MVIRDITLNEVDNLENLCRSCCMEMGYPFKWETSKASLENVINNGWFAKVVTEDSEYIGLGVAMIAPSYLDDSCKTAIEMVWHSDPALHQIRRGRIMIYLLREMEVWANDEGIPLHISTSTDSTMKLLERRGFEVKEIHYGN